MRSRLTAAAAILGALVGLGLALAGFFVGEALKEARSAERFVTVRGFAERNVESDLVIWPITFRDTGNDLTELQKVVDSHKAEVRTFRAAAGFKPEEVSEDNMVLLAHDLARKIESELEYPGQIKINVIRETKAVDYAK